MRRDFASKEQAAVGFVAGASLGELKPMCSGILFCFCLHATVQSAVSHSEHRLCEMCCCTVLML